jgi:aspartyl-tRNA(Asn)/glutamyl-tRNA(Gln) amidotransferase subunit C
LAISFWQLAVSLLLDNLAPTDRDVYSSSMTTLTKAQVLHIAKLARLELKDGEAEKMATELSSILKYVDILGEVPTDSVEPTAQVTGLETVLRDDIVKPSEALPDALLACSPLPITEHQIEAPHAHG